MKGEQSNIAPSVVAKGRYRWHFAQAVLDGRTLELTVSGALVDIERKPLEVLCYLLQHAGEVCTKDELLTGVWPGRVLSETVLTKCIGRIREVLGDADQEIIKTVYGFGYRLCAAVRVESLEVIEPPKLGFRPGDSPQGRPLWKLIERLGVGGHGEAWRARHEKTHEQHVFKFALDESSLGALKREITLFRVVNDLLKEDAQVVRLLDWNLEQVPYFIEAEYLTGGNLVDWAAQRGGVSALPMHERLRVVASIASALSAVHSVGVLHKDLKPSNVFVKPMTDGSVQIRLADFGSGALLDPSAMEKLGITRLGFTRTVAATEAGWGTPMYLAPEVLAGQPFTVKSDIYALGVILFQFVVGDFRKMMSPGWERLIDDELLREDIALLVEGTPAMRLADAEVVGRHLLELETRREELRARRDAQAKAERTRRLLERAQARRIGLIAAFAALALGLAASSYLYVQARAAQERGEVAAARANAVVEFLGNDVFAPVSSGLEPTKDMTLGTLLARAGEEIDARFASQPDIASRVHFVVGRAFDSLYDSPSAVKHFGRALELGQNLDGEGSESALRSAAELILIEYALGTLRHSITKYEAALQAGNARMEPTAPVLLELRLRLARGYYLLGRWPEAEAAFAALLQDVVQLREIEPAFLGRTRFHFGQLLTDLARQPEAQSQLQHAIAALRADLGEQHVLVAEAAAALGRSYGEQSQYELASAQLDIAADLAARWAPPDTWTAVRPRYFRALMLLQQGKAAEAEPLLKQIVDYEDAHKAAYLEAHQEATPEVDHTGPVRQALGEAYTHQGKYSDALSVLQRAIEVGAIADGEAHPNVLSARLSLAQAMLESSREINPDVQAVLSAVPSEVIQGLPAVHPIRAQWHYIAGLVASMRQDMASAQASLSTALHIYEKLYGPQHWRAVGTRRAFQAVQG